VPYLYADIYGIVTGLSIDERRQVTQVTSRPYRLGLAFITVAPLPFAFTGQPLTIVVVYTIIGSLFVPFLAATLLYLNNRVRWADAQVPRNAPLTNLLLVAILGLFLYVGVQEVVSAARRLIG
jgi:hypothetical protein